VGLVGVGHSSIGVVEFQGDQNAGFNPALHFDSPGTNGTLNLSAIVRIGSLEIRQVETNN
jgi:hypothetical protein